MRNTSLITISLPPTMVKEYDKLAQNEQMTRSEFIRAALRKFAEELAKARAKRLAWEEQDTFKAIRTAEREYKAGKAKVLKPGELAKLLK